MYNLNIRTRLNNKQSQETKLSWRFPDFFLNKSPREINENNEGYTSGGGLRGTRRLEMTANQDTIFRLG